MSTKDVPIKKKQVKEVLKGLTWAERLLVLEPLAEHCRKMARREVYKDEKKKGIDDYPT